MEGGVESMLRYMSLYCHIPQFLIIADFHIVPQLFLCALVSIHTFLQQHRLYRSKAEDYPCGEQTI
jgi:NADH:ubiquinone oxidoreductase subunit 3 (subunit A)